VAVGRITARGMSARYERRTSRTAEVVSSADSELLMWKELDEHRDPTLEPEERSGRDRLSRPSEADEADGKSGH
jgi:hypothetical protein